MTPLLAFLTALIACACLLAALERVAPKFGLLDKPSGHKTHTHPTPVVGGIAITLSLFVVPLTDSLPPDAFWLFVGVGLSLLLGLADDLLHMRAQTKLYFMTGIFALALTPPGLLLERLGELLPGVQVFTGVIAVPLTLFAAVGVINAFNLIDGMDGLAGTVAACLLSGFLLLALAIGAHEWVPFIVITLAAVLAFLAFNMRLPGRSRARLFMGDAGSLVVGFVLFWLSVALSQRSSGAVPPMVMVWLMAFPMLDTVATMALRIRERTSIFTPGHDHFHHLLSQHGAPVQRVVALTAVLTSGLAATGMLLWQLNVPEWISCGLFLAVTAAYVRLNLKAWARLGRASRALRNTAAEARNPT